MIIFNKSFYLTTSILTTIAIATNLAHAVGISTNESDLAIPTINQTKADGYALAPLSVPIELTEYASGTLPTGSVGVYIDGNTYYFSPTDSTDSLIVLLSSTLAGDLIKTGNNGTDAGIFSFGGINYTFDISKIPNSGYTLRKIDASESPKPVLTVTKYLENPDKSLSPIEYEVVVNQKYGNPQTSDITSIGYNWIKNIEGDIELGAFDGTGNIIAEMDKEQGDIGGTPIKYYNWQINSTTGNWEFVEGTSADYDIVAKSTDNTRISITSGDYGDINHSFVGLTNSSSTPIGGAIDISTSASDSVKIGDINADFIGNFISNNLAYGGAIYINSLDDSSVTIDNINGNFIGNYAAQSSEASSTKIARGGAISLTSSESSSIYIKNITGDFIGNYTIGDNGSSGGAISINSPQQKTSVIDNITGNFIGNYSLGNAIGGAIINTSSIIHNITGNFISNYIENYYCSGGAIRLAYGYIGYINADFIGNYANGSYAEGGTFIVDDSKVNTITGDFIGNYISGSSGYGGFLHVTSESKTHGDINVQNIFGDFIANHITTKYDAEGGAIYNKDSVIGNIVGDFTGNYVTTQIRDAFGGAIYNIDNVKYNIGTEIYNIVGDFTNNFAISDAREAKGGAIYNMGESAEIFGLATIHNITGSFINNYASSNTGSALGGAIYNGEFAFLTLNADGKDILFSGNYVENSGTITSNAIYNEGTINFKSANNYNIISYDAFSGVGNYYLNENSRLSLLGENANFAADSKLTTYAGAVLSTIDNETRVTSLGELTLDGDIFYGMDVRVVDGNLQGDELTGTLLGGSGSIIINEINVLGMSSTPQVTIDITNSFSHVMELATNETITDDWDAILYDKLTGILTLKRGLTLNEVVVENEAVKSYNMDEQENITQTLSVLEGETLTINGNNFDIVGSGTADGITMAANQKLALNNIHEVSGFTNSFVNATGGDVEINADTGTTTTFANKITGNANIEINSGTTKTGSIVFNDETSANSINIEHGVATFNKNVSAAIINNASININNAEAVGDITGTGVTKTSGTTTLNSSEITNDVTVESGTTTFSNAKINGDIGGDGNIAFAGVSELNGVLTTDKEILNTGSLKINSDLTLVNKFKNGSADFSERTLTLSGAEADFEGTTLTATNGTINASDDGIQTYDLGNATFTGVTNLSIDVDFNLPTGPATNDTFIGAVTGTMRLTDINVIYTPPVGNVSGASGSLDIFTSSNVSILDSSLTILESDYTLTLTTNTTDFNELDYTIIAANNTLQSAIISLVSPREYTMSSDESAGVDSSLAGTATINGNGYTINAGNIDMQAGSELTLNDANVAAKIDANNNNINIIGAGTYEYSGDINNAYIDVDSGVNINRTATDTNVNYIVNSGTLSYSKDEFLSDGTNSLMFNGGGLNLVNKNASLINLNSLTLGSDINLALDVDLAAREMDKISAVNFNANGFVINIDALNITSHATGVQTVVEVTNQLEIANAINDDLSATNMTVVSPIYVYDATYAVNGNNGELTFTRKDGIAGITPVVRASNIAKQAHTGTMIDITKKVLDPNRIITNKNNHASGDNGAYPFASVWSEFSGNNETIKLDSISVDNESFVGIIGADVLGARIKDFDTLYSFYAASINSNQEYDDIETQQDGFAIGVAVTVNNDNIENATTANFATSFVDESSSAGTSEFRLHSLSIANKTSYEHKIKGTKIKLVPSLSIGYHYIRTLDYTNANGTRISSDATHVINANPEIKVLADYYRYKPYASLGIHWNINYGGDITATDVIIPNLAVNNYIELAIGSEIKFSDALMGFIELNATDTDRQGLGGKIGIKWDF